MEPLFFKAENVRRLQLDGFFPCASMEPLFFKAENEIDSSVAGVPIVSFNGAAFFQSGKCNHRVGLYHARSGGFNGAAFFQSGKSNCPSDYLPNTFLLQWSRFFSKRKILAGGFYLPPDSRFNGAAFFQSGKSHHVTQDTAYVCALQWSRFFSNRKI